MAVPRVLPDALRARPRRRVAVHWMRRLEERNEGYSGEETETKTEEETGTGGRNAGGRTSERASEQPTEGVAVTDERESRSAIESETHSSPVASRLAAQLGGREKSGVEACGRDSE